MDKDVLNFVIEKTHDLMKAPSCSKEAKDAAIAWLAAVGTADEVMETKKYIAELEADIMPIDGLIAFAGSEQAIKIFGADGAKHALTHAQDLKAKGEKFCDCPACTACAAILAKKSQIL